jgi:mono/diheme cytochrome c family protein
LSAVTLLLAIALAAGSPVRREVPVDDPLDGVARVYRGVPLLELLPPGASGDAVLVHCLDGFVVLLPLELVRRVDPVVADEVQTSVGWEAIPAPRGPRYLVWPNRDRPELDRDPAITTEGWAWGVSEVTSVSIAAYLAPLTPASRDPRVARGRQLWLSSCFHCHALAGAGGIAGWDLAKPVPVWRYLDGPQIAASVANPRSTNPDGHMPAQKLTKAEVAELLAFLRAAVAP